MQDNPATLALLRLGLLEPRAVEDVVAGSATSSTLPESAPDPESSGQLRPPLAAQDGDERQQDAADASRQRRDVEVAAVATQIAIGAASNASRQRRDVEVAAIATQIAIGAASAAFAHQTQAAPAKDEHAAAARIQSLQRGKQARRELQEQKEAAVKIQALQRGKQERRELQEQTEAAVKIQAVQRGKQARKVPQGGGTEEPAAGEPAAEESAAEEPAAEEPAAEEPAAEQPAAEEPAAEESAAGDEAAEGAVPVAR